MIILKHLSKKFQKLEDSLRLRYAQSVALGQEEESVAHILSASNNDLENEKKYQVMFNTICNCRGEEILSGKW